jgi:hypothetical protein
LTPFDGEIPFLRRVELVIKEVLKNLQESTPVFYISRGFVKQLEGSALKNPPFCKA